MEGKISETPNTAIDPAYLLSLQKCESVKMQEEIKKEQAGKARDMFRNSSKTIIKKK